MSPSPSLMQARLPTPHASPVQQLNATPAGAIPFPCLTPALVSGVVLWMCFHPVAWGPLAWVALVPLLCLVRSERRPRNIYFAAWLGGMVFFVAAIQWMRVADLRMGLAWILLSIYCALYIPAAVYLTRVLERRTVLPLALTFPAVWVALEFVRSFLLTGFPWYYMAHSQHEFLTIVQITDLGGAYTVSLLVVAVNAVIFDVLYQFRAVRTLLQMRHPVPGQHTLGDDLPGLANTFIGAWRRGLFIDLVAVAVVAAAAYLYGEWRLRQATMRSGPVVALLQTNLDTRLHDNSAELPTDERLRRRVQMQREDETRDRMGQEYDRLCQLAHRVQPHPELFISPETSFPRPSVAIAPDLPRDEVPPTWRNHEQAFREVFQQYFKRYQTPQLLGLGTHYLVDTKGTEWHLNSALYLNANGNPEARYDKMHPVPFGEYVPLNDWLPMLKWITPFELDEGIHPGTKFTRFALDDYHFGVLICYEDGDPFLARHYVRDESDGPPVDFLVNMSNDGWFDGTSEHDEHLAVSRFRAIECRRALVRSANMGISAVIDGNGKVLRAVRANDAQEPDPVWSVAQTVGPEALPHADWASFKKVSGVLVASVPIDNRFSFYAYAGDWLPGVCWLMILIGTVGMWSFRKFWPALRT